MTDVDNSIADVAVHGNYAYLANWGRPTCAANSEAGGRTTPDAGAYVIDISNLSAPLQVGFIPHYQDSRPGEGVQVVNVSTRFYSGDMLVMNSEQCGKNGKGGVVLWDVTNPLRPKQLSAHFGDRESADSNDTHSAFAWDAGEKAYVVIVDGSEATDLDILDITNPKRPRLIAEYNLNSHFGQPISQPSLGLDQSFLHDTIVKKINGRFILLGSYWDGGFVQLDVTDPRNPTLIGDTDYVNPDPELLDSTGIALPPEGNAHQAEFTADNRFFIGTDEDSNPYRAISTIDAGPNAGQYQAGEAGWTIPVMNLPDAKLNGPTVYGGYGCPEGTAIPPAMSVLPAVGPGEERIVVLQRGPVDDPSASYDACLFSEKAEMAQIAGYDAVVIANNHTGAGGGTMPNAQFCDSQGHAFTVTASAVCIGHRPFHLLFDTSDGYTYPEAAPAVRQLGQAVSFTPAFDGWGYVHLFDAATMQGLDTFAVNEAHDPAYHVGFGDLTVHEVATHPTVSGRAYLSYRSAGVRALAIECANPSDTTTCALVEVGSYLDSEGNDFWGVEVFERDGSTYILASDSDSGLWIFCDNCP